MQEGTVLDGRYRLIEPIGAGGFGQTWKAHDPKVGRLVAVKVLTGDGSVDNDPQAARCAREAAVAGGLSHPHIVTVHDFGSAMHDGRLYRSVGEVWTVADHQAWRCSWQSSSRGGCGGVRRPAAASARS
ncbi:hypothetical protein ACIP4Y_36400 [Streptomyces sp. NPDC088810]|uniref:hypothetical protein n=1 Tax=Streptomyces sp. NPDC088810 TaxID=3365904 RepID=UPI00382ADDF7